MEEKTKRKKPNFLKLTMYTAVFGIMSGVSFYGINQLGSNAKGNESQIANLGSTNGIQTSNFSQVETITKAAISTVENEDGVSKIADAVLPSIVKVQVKSIQQVSDMLGRTYEQEQSGMGSGVIVGQDKTHVYIVTNAHVVQGSTEVEIYFNNEAKISAVVKGTDSIADLAVLAVKIADLSQETISHIKIAQFGSSTDAKVGQQVVAIGNSLGYGTSVTVGYLSAKEREVEFEDGTRVLLQTDAAINPGNSGGALVDSTGKMIGINCGGVVDVSVEGINYAIPISDAIPIINRLMTQKPKSENEKAYLGITGKEISEQEREFYSIPEGIYISEVTEGSPAERAGLKSGDIITAIDDRNVINATQLQEQLGEKSPGDKIVLAILSQRNGQYVEDEIRITLGRRAS